MTLDFIRKFFSFIRSVFSEGGEGSYSRVAAGAIVVATIVWVSHVVWHTHAMPDLTGPAAFLTVGSGTHYGLNKAPDIIAAFKGQINPTNPQGNNQ
jgi:hypothetical protein